MAREATKEDMEIIHKLAKEISELCLTTKVELASQALIYVVGNLIGNIKMSDPDFISSCKNAGQLIVDTAISVRNFRAGIMSPGMVVLPIKVENDGDRSDNSNDA